MMNLARRVAVIDDEPDGRDTIVDQLQDCDYDAIPILGPFGNRIDKLIDEVEGLDPSFVICDQRLTAKQYASFNGVEVVKRLIELKRPAMLLTTYQDPDRVALRLARSQIPVIRGRDTFRIEDIDALREVVQHEIEDTPVASRKPHRVLMRVEAVREGYIDIVIPSWNPNHAFALPVQLLGPAVRRSVKAGDYLLGEVNIGATHEDELFFDNVDEVVEAAGNPF
ncbi:hypothetical protein JYU29_12500 [Tianweitania sp. BSSL-BM11]|uniref:Response regulatory domain-containing protein n=1 Tax=Tianweitania aestuarii TaxID=2814886 RepID=A0ABS5RWW4_9HYPH|nr:hypothetical protein [Tianweitania aestuarii]MBS9721504.1 hypothetical protein [Tianweitania aestuarii]